MLKFYLSALFLGLSACIGATSNDALLPSATPVPLLSIEPYLFTAGDGTEVEAEKGTFEVPENRNDPTSRKIAISFVRFKSTSHSPGAPIVYLAGGPGGSGTGAAQGARFPLFMALRGVADVIAYDQRGTGMSETMPDCPADPPFDIGATVTRASLTAFYREGLSRCFEWWEAQGVDIDGYTTLENAADIEDLRRALGAEKLDLWGISYGSHLGLAVMKYHGSSVGRAVLSGIEGLDQTIKRPAITDKLFTRVQKLVDADPAAKALYPDLADTMRRVTARLNANPETATFTPRGANEPVSVTFDGYALQLLTAQSIADPPVIANVPLLWFAADNGSFTQVAQAIYSIPQQLGAFDGMADSMDLASGVTSARLALVQLEAESSLLSDALNFPMPHILGTRPQIDLGDEFRAPFESDIPTLFISATLDGRTYPEEATEEVKGFSNKRRLIVENGGHNIYEADQRVADAVAAFFRGEPTPESLYMAPPNFRMP